MIAQFVCILMLLLSIGFLGVRFAASLRIPHSVFLVLLGILSGFLVRERFPETLQSFGTLFPDLILTILLPPLIFESAFHLNFNLLKKDIVPITALAVVALVVSTFFVGYGLSFTFNIPLLPCLTFGALISATDPVAVVALFKEVGAPIRLASLIEGESLLNDGTAMVLFRLFMAATWLSLNPQEPSSVATIASVGIVACVGQFFWLVSGSLLLGLAIAVFMSFLLRIVSNSGSAQLGVIIASAYLSFLISDSFFHLSGVMTTLVVGLYLGQRLRLEVNSSAIQALGPLLEFLALSANILVFFAIGLVFQPDSILVYSNFIPIVIIIVYLARAISIGTTVPIVNSIQRHTQRPIHGRSQDRTHSAKISFAYQTVLMWGGLRGGLACALVLTLPNQFPYRELFVTLTVAVVLTTLILNALSTPQILKILGLDQLTPSDHLIFKKAFQLATSKAYRGIQAIAESGDLSPRLIEQHQIHYLYPRQEQGSQVFNQAEIESRIQLQFQLTSLFSSERQSYELRLQEGTLSKLAFLELVDLLNARKALSEADGLAALGEFRFQFDQKLNALEKFQFIFYKKSSLRFLRSLTVRLEILLTLKSVLDVPVPNPTLKQFYKNWLLQVRNELIQFYKNYSHYSGAMQALIISQSFWAISKKEADFLYRAKIINQSIHAKLEKQFDHILSESKSQARLNLRPSALYLLKRIPVFQLFPQDTLRKLAEACPVRVISAREVVTYRGENRPALFVVIAGILRSKALQEKDSEFDQTYLQGDFYGTQSLIFGELQANTVVTEMTSEVVEVTQNHLNAVFFDYPFLKEKTLGLALKNKGSFEFR